MRLLLKYQLLHTSKQLNKGYSTNGNIKAKDNFHFGWILVWKHILMESVYLFLGFILWDCFIPYGNSCWVSQTFCVKSYSRWRKKVCAEPHASVKWEIVFNYKICNIMHMYVNSIYACMCVCIFAYIYSICVCLCTNFNTKNLDTLKTNMKTRCSLQKNVQSANQSGTRSIYHCE